MVRFPHLLLVLFFSALTLAAQYTSRPDTSSPGRPFYKADQNQTRRPFYRPIQPPTSTAKLNKALTVAIGAAKADILITRAKYYLAAGLNESARREFDRALAVDPESEAVIVRVASLITAEGIRDRCKRVNDIADDYLSKHPRSDVVLAERAKAKKCLGHVDGAFEDLKTALGIAPQNVAYLLGLMNIPRGFADVEQSLAIYKKVIDFMSARIAAGRTTQWPELDRGVLSNTYSGRASVYAKIGDRNARLADMNKAVELSPSNRALRAYIFEEYEMYDESIADITAYIKYLMRPENPRPQKNFWQEYSFRASVLAKAGRYSEAIQDYETALEMSPRNGWIQERITQVRQKAHRSPQ